MRTAACGGWRRGLAVLLAGLSLIPLVETARGADGYPNPAGASRPGVAAMEEQGRLVMDQYYATGPTLGAEERIGSEALVTAFTAAEQPSPSKKRLRDARKRRRGR